MAAVNFPDPADSPWTNPDNGVTYFYDSGVWKVLSGTPSGTGFVKLDDGGAKQVIKSAGIGISDGTDENITLNADGGAAFTGEVKVEGPNTPASLSSRISKYGSLLIGTTSEAVGDALFNVDSGNGNLTSKGSATFAKEVVSGNSTANGTGVVVRSSGSVVIRQDTATEPVFQVFSGGNTGSEKNAEIKANGIATFAGYNIESLDALP